MLITPIVAGFGTAVVAAYGASLQVIGFGISIIAGTGLGLSSLVGHNIGGQKFERAKATADRAILVSFGIMAVIGALTFVFAGQYMRMFFESADAVQFGVSILRILAISFPFFGAYIMLEQIHLGVGLNAPSMCFSIVHSWFLQVLPAVIVTQFFGFSEDAVWWVLTCSGIVTTIMIYIYYRHGRWATAKVKNPSYPLPFPFLRSRFRNMLWKLTKLVIWYTFACGVFALMAPHLMVNDALISMAGRTGRVVPDNAYFLSVSFLRVCGVLLLAFAMSLHLLIKQGWTLENLKLTLTVVAINVLVWAAAFLFLITTRSAVALTIVGLALLIWLLIPLMLLFDYKKADSWKSVKQD